MVNEHTIDRMRELLALSDLDDIISQFVTSDVELLLNFILQVRELYFHCYACAMSIPLSSYSATIAWAL